MFCQGYSRNIQLWKWDHQKAWIKVSWGLCIVFLGKMADDTGLQEEEKKSLDPRWTKVRLHIKSINNEAKADILCTLNVNARVIGDDPVAWKNQSLWRGWQQIRWLDIITDDISTTTQKFEDLNLYNDWITKGIWLSGRCFGLQIP